MGNKGIGKASEQKPDGHSNRTYEFLCRRWQMEMITAPEKSAKIKHLKDWQHERKDFSGLCNFCVTFWPECHIPTSCYHYTSAESQINWLMQYYSKETWCLWYATDTDPKSTKIQCFSTWNHTEKTMLDWLQKMYVLECPPQWTPIKTVWDNWRSPMHSILTDRAWWICKEEYLGRPIQRLELL